MDAEDQGVNVLDASSLSMEVGNDDSFIGGRVLVGMLCHFFLGWTGACTSAGGLELEISGGTLTFEGI